MTKQKCTDCEKLERELTEVKQELKAANDLTLSRIRIERWLGRWLDENITQGGDQKSNGHDDRLILSDIDVSENTARQMSQGGIPQGKYAGLWGQNQSCNVVLRMMGLTGHARKKPLFKYKKMFKGLMRWI